MALPLDSKPKVLVTVPPYKHFVERIAGDTVDILILVPPGVNPHSYEPSPRTMLQASQAKIWFLVGEGFEKRAATAFLDHNPQMQLVDIQKGIPLLKEGCHSHPDPHTWLNPVFVKIQVKTITDSLSRILPEHQSKYELALKRFLLELDQLDQNIKMQLLPLKGSSFVVSHPAYAYFCQEYGLKQISIEQEGKEPSPKQITRLINFLKSEKIHTIFVQPYATDKAATLIANLLKANIVEINPLAENYTENLMKIVQNLSQDRDKK